MNKCPVCGGRDVTLIARNVKENLGLLGCTYAFIRCLDCGVISQWPQPSEGILAHYYQLIESKQQVWYASAQGQIFLAKVESRGRHRHPLLKQVIRFFLAGEQLYPYWHLLRTGSIVDLGAGSGGFCLEAGRRKLTVVGVEQSGVSVDLARRYGVSMIKADLASSSVRDLVASASNVVMNHVFEHIQSPTDFLSDLRSSMSPNARLILMIPNPDSIWRFVFGRRWYGWDPPVHVHHYSAKVLQNILQKAGFDIVVLRSVGRSDSLATAIGQVGVSPARFRLLLKALMIPIMPLVALIGLGPELLCVATVRSAGSALTCSGDDDTET